MSTASSDDGDLVTGINVTPLVDITLVLLVVMMVTAPMIAEARLSMRLPTAAPDGAAIEERLVVEIAADGSMTVDGDRVDASGLQALLARGRLPSRATIRADREVRHGVVMATLDSLRQAGIARVAFAVSPR